jgi:hypothetical protein
MVKLKSLGYWMLFSVSFGSLFPCFAAAASTVTLDDVLFHNQLDGCIEIVPCNLRQTHNAIFLNTQWKVKSDMRRCGCNSDLLIYKVFTRSNQEMSEISRGVCSPRDGKPFTFVIDPDFEQRSYGSFVVYVKCKNSDSPP